MHKLFQAIQDLLPYSLDEEKFLKPENSVLIQRKLKELATLAKETDHTSLIKTPTFKASSRALKVIIFLNYSCEFDANHAFGRYIGNEPYSF